MDLFLKKQDLENDIIFDLILENNDIKKDNTILTSTLLSIFTDASKTNISEFIDGEIYGNKYYNINKLSEDNIKLYKKGLEDALNFLIEDNIVISNNIDVKAINNKIYVTIEQILDDNNTNNLKYSLDTNMELLND
jgi:phage gp46-like protein